MDVLNGDAFERDSIFTQKTKYSYILFSFLWGLPASSTKFIENNLGSVTKQRRYLVDTSKHKVAYCFLVLALTIAVIWFHLFRHYRTGCISQFENVLHLVSGIRSEEYANCFNKNGNQKEPDVFLIHAVVLVENWKLFCNK